jgi:hypothetical protein
LIGPYKTENLKLPQNKIFNVKMECLYLWHTYIEGENFEQIIWDKSAVWMETHWELREHHGGTNTFVTCGTSLGTL